MMAGLFVFPGENIAGMRKKPAPFPERTKRKAFFIWNKGYQISPVESFAPAGMKAILLKGQTVRPESHFLSPAMQKFLEVYEEELHQLPLTAE